MNKKANTAEEWLGANNQLGVDIYTGKYTDETETFSEWIYRVSGGNDEVARLILERKFLLGGRILSNRGMAHHRKCTMSNCYVTSVEDSIEGIFETASKIARTFSYGGGIGVDISPLAPRGAQIHNAAKTTSGAVSFMELYSLVTGLIGQNGRRGALMLSISCDHPDVEEFIDIKNDLNKVNYANISVRVADAFMKAVDADADFVLTYERTATGEQISKTIRARDLMRKLAKNNWETGEPGVLFWDRIRDWNMIGGHPNFEFAGTNPCGELPLPTGGACLLGSMNLAEYVQDGEFDYASFRTDVRTCVRALNDVLDEGIPLHPLQEQRDNAARWRQIGLGIMGLADMLIKMGITYGSERALMVCEEIGHTMANAAVSESIRLAEEFGPYPGWNEVEHHEYAYDSEYAKTVLTPQLREALKTTGIRNAQLLTIAPTGSLSSMLGISSGIEPIFDLSYTRKTESLHNKEVYYKVYTPIVAQYMERQEVSSEAELPEYFVTAQNLPYEQRIAMQSVWQKYVDSSISSTVNLPADATPEDIESLYMCAWRNNLKGITVFRNGCKRAGVLTSADNDTQQAQVRYQLGRGDIICCDDTLPGRKRKLMTGCGTLHLQVYYDPETGDIMETFVDKGGSGGCERNQSAVSRLISLSLRGGISLDDVVDQLSSVGVCPSFRLRAVTQQNTSAGSSCPVAIAMALKEMQEEIWHDVGCETENTTAVKEISHTQSQGENETVTCPECGSAIVFEGGCNVCKACGWSRCE